MVPVDFENIFESNSYQYQTDLFEFQSSVFKKSLADPESGIRCLFDPWIRDRFFSGSPKGLVTIFYAKSAIIRSQLAQIFFCTCSSINNFQNVVKFLKFVALQNKVRRQIFSLLFFLLLLDPGLMKIRIQDPG